MAIGEKSTTISGVRTFSDVVEKACEGLKNQQIKYSIQRIQEMEEYLSAMELELDAFIASAAYRTKRDFK
jgi:hypothetical protein